MDIIRKKNKEGCGNRGIKKIWKTTGSRPKMSQIGIDGD